MREPMHLSINSRGKMVGSAAAAAFDPAEVGSPGGAIASMKCRRVAKSSTLGRRVAKVKKRRKRQVASKT